LVPAVWSLKVANAILVGERRKRLNQPEIKQFMTLPENLPFVQDTRRVAMHISDVLPLARAYGLSAYAAAYLELSIRHNTPLATLDDKMQTAARAAGVAIFKGDPSG
jgi:predicted nucleic acid-binding protein